MGGRSIVKPVLQPWCCWISWLCVHLHSLVACLSSCLRNLPLPFHISVNILLPPFFFFFLIINLNTSAVLLNCVVMVINAFNSTYTLGSKTHILQSDSIFTAHNHTWILYIAMAMCYLVHFCPLLTVSSLPLSCREGCAWRRDVQYPLPTICQ